MDLFYLPKLLLQHDDNPLVAADTLHQTLLGAAEEDRVKCAASPSGMGVAVALERRLVVAQQRQPPPPPQQHGSEAGAQAGPGGSRSSRRIGGDSVEFAAVVEAPEVVTSMAWLPPPEEQAQAPSGDCLLLGTSAGFLQIHSSSGQLLHREDVHSAALVSIAVGAGALSLDPGGEGTITLCAADAVVRLRCADVHAIVAWHAGRRGRGWWGVAPSPPQLALTKWQLPRGTGPRTYALSLGAPLPSLYTVLLGRQQAPKVQLFTAGSSPPLAMLQGDESKPGGLLSLLGRARASLPSRAAAAAAVSGGSAGGAKRANVRGASAALAASVWDEKRTVTRVSLSPCGRLAACCDNLGRVMLVDAAATLVVRMLKGYRDAQVAWVVGPQGLQRSRRPRNRQQQGQQQQGSQGASVSAPAQVPAGGAGPAAAGPAERAAPPSAAQWEARWSDSEESEVAAPRGALASAAAAAARVDAAEAGAAAGGTAELRMAAGAAAGAPGDAPVGHAVRTAPSLASLASVGAGTPSSSSGALADLQWEDEQQRESQHAAGPPAAGEGTGPRPAQQQPGCQQAYLVVYAPRRAVVEVWQPLGGRRVAAVRCQSQHGVLLQQPTRRRRGPAAGAGPGVGAGPPPGPGPAGGAVGGAARPYEPNSVWLLDLESLQLLDLGEALLGSGRGGGGGL